MHGGASLPDYMLAFSNFSGREIIHIEEKRRAALKALEHLRPGSVIALNSGTTNVILAQELIKRFTDLTIVTNNVSAAMVLMQNQSLRTIVLGGDLDSLEHSTYGSICEKNLAGTTLIFAFCPLTALMRKLVLQISVLLKLALCS